MPIPLFIIYELLTRIHQIDPTIGSYVSHKLNTNGAVLTTSNRTIRIRKAILNRQFKDPTLVTEADLLQLIAKPELNKVKSAPITANQLI